jgi:hypothetical protein
MMRRPGGTNRIVLGGRSTRRKLSNSALHGQLDRWIWYADLAMRVPLQLKTSDATLLPGMVHTSSVAKLFAKNMLHPVLDLWSMTAIMMIVLAMVVVGEAEDGTRKVMVHCLHCTFSPSIAYNVFYYR